VSKKGKNKNEDATKREEKVRSKEDIQQEFDPELHGIPHLDELALRLSVPEAQEGDPGIVMFGKSGRAYPFVTILANIIQFQVEAVMHVASMVERMEMNKGEETSEGAGQSEKSVDPTRDPDSSGS